MGIIRLSRPVTMVEREDHTRIMRDLPKFPARVLIDDTTHEICGVDPGVAYWMKPYPDSHHVS